MHTNPPTHPYDESNPAMPSQPEASTSQLPTNLPPPQSQGWQRTVPPTTQFAYPSRDPNLPFPNIQSMPRRAHTRQSSAPDLMNVHFETDDDHLEEPDSNDSDSESSASSSSYESRAPRRMKSAVPVFGTTRTVYDMPIRGSRDAPKTFRGHHSEVEYFIAHYDRLLVKFHVNDPRDQCECIINYCSTDVQGFIRASEYFHKHNWPKLRKEILRCYDADRATSRYKPSDIAAYTLKTQKRPFHSLSQWKKYFIKYKTMAGMLLQQGHLTKLNYDVYFWLGIHPDLRPILEQRILQLNPRRKSGRQLSVKEISDAAEWYFRRNRAEAMVINAADYGIDLDSDTSDDESDEHESDDSDDSDYEVYRRKHRAKLRKRKEKEKEKKKKKSSSTSGVSPTRTTLKTTGTAEEVSTLIRQLNKMSITDPEYPPVYYKVLALDTTGIAAKCVQPPRVNTSWGDQPSRNPPRNKQPPPPPPPASTSQSAPPPVTYPNNIPVAPSNTARNETTACYGCGQEGHRIGECPGVQDLLRKEVIRIDEDTRKLRMKDGTYIRRTQGETLVQAAARLSAPRVMFTSSRPVHGKAEKASAYHQQAPRNERASINTTIPEWELDSETESYDSGDEDEPLDAHWYAAVSDSDNDSSLEDGEVYLTVPRADEQPAAEDLQVNAAERTVPSTRSARKETFDGVQMPRRDKIREGVTNAPARVVEMKDRSKRQSNDVPPPTVKDLLPPLTPVDVRTPRDVDVDMEIDSPEVKQDKLDRKSKSSSQGRQPKTTTDAARAKDLQEDTQVSKTGGRQSEIQNSVHIPAIIDRILDLTIPMTVREAFVASKDIRTGILDTIRLKNVKAVLLGKGPDNPIVASWNWPRSEGVLIKIDVTTGGRTISAIVDTGSQLDVVRADIAALKIQRPIDMSRIMSMNDANGGKGQLQGFVGDVEFNCGGVLTFTDLWMSQQAPFELLLGRPWQRGNLVSIDERDEGTYLVFKDRETRKPRSVEAWNVRAELKSTPTTKNNAVSSQEIADYKVNHLKQEWRWRTTFWHTVGNPGTVRTLCGDEMQQITPAMEWNTEMAVAEDDHNISHPNAVWCVLEDSRYGMKNLCLRRNEVAHRYRAIIANDQVVELKRHDKSGGRLQYTNTHTPNFDQTKLTFEPTFTMTNLPLPPKPAETAPGKRFTPSSRGRFVHHPPRLIPNPRPLPSNSRAPPIPRPLPPAAPNLRNRASPPCRVLERRRVGDLGPVDFYPREPNTERRMTTATEGMLASPQAMYTGGLPAERTGHAEVRLFATPDDNTALVRYGPFRRREVSMHQREGRFALTTGRIVVKEKDETANDKPADSPSDSPADSAGTWRRHILPIPKISLRRIAAAAAAAKAAEDASTESTQGQDDTAVSAANPVSADAGPAPMDTDAAPSPQPVGASKAHTLRFLLRPVDQPPTSNTSGLVRLGNAADSGDNVFAVNAVPGNGGPRYDTPHPPLRLYDSPPALKPIADEAMDVVNDGGEEMEGVEGTTTPRISPASAPAVTMPAKGAPATASPSALVFGAFISPHHQTPTSPTSSTRTNTSSTESGMDEDDVKSPVIPPARPPTAAENSSEQVESNACRLAALELDTPRPASLALASANLGSAHGSLATPVLNEVLATTPATLLGKRAPSPIDFDDAELVSTSSSEEGEIKEEEDSPGYYTTHLFWPPLLAAHITVVAASVSLVDLSSLVVLGPSSGLVLWYRLRVSDASALPLFHLGRFRDFGHLIPGISRFFPSTFRLLEFVPDHRVHPVPFGLSSTSTPSSPSPLGFDPNLPVDPVASARPRSFPLALGFDSVSSGQLAFAGLSVRKFHSGSASNLSGVVPTLSSPDALTSFGNLVFCRIQ
ncbi:hypothetical protein DFH06DRAFT_1329208 [Mycena polygramma]|nr:hypothetical protein DFH06DRAFT_1329208 [Mycena polygramma]